MHSRASGAGQGVGRTWSEAGNACGPGGVRMNGSSEAEQV
jgi:hypothetical protein